MPPRTTRLRVRGRPTETDAKETVEREIRLLITSNEGAVRHHQKQCGKAVIFWVATGVHAGM